MANERERVNEQKGAPPKLNSYIYEIDADESPIASTSHNGPTARASTELIGRVTLAWMTPCYPRVAVCFLRRPDQTTENVLGAAIWWVDWPVAQVPDLAIARL